MGRVAPLGAQAVWRCPINAGGNSEMGLVALPDKHRRYASEIAHVGAASISSNTKKGSLLPLYEGFTWERGLLREPEITTVIQSSRPHKN